MFKTTGWKTPDSEATTTKCQWSQWSRLQQFHGFEIELS
jgi:hypothetical protein